jgi:hypothetical protein
MIIKEFNYGWGPEYPIVCKEQEIVHSYLAPIINDASRTVIINSTWYGHEQHARTMSWLENHDWDRLMLVAMLDAALISPEPRMGRRGFNDLQRPVHAMGSFRGPHEIIFWALIVDDYFTKETTVDVSLIDRPWISYNRKPHPHRRQLFRDLRRHGMLDSGVVSFGAHEHQDVVSVDDDVVGNNLAPNGDIKHYGLPNDICSLGNLNTWRRCFLNVVTETCFDVSANWFVSEKIFKPIVGLKPFVLVAEDGGVRWLQEHGFEHYCDDFRDITDVKVSDPYNVIMLLKALNEAGIAYWRKKTVELMDKMLYNQNQFAALVKQQRDKIAQGVNL